MKKTNSTQTYSNKAEATRRRQAALAALKIAKAYLIAAYEADPDPAILREIGEVASALGGLEFDLGWGGR